MKEDIAIAIPKKKIVGEKASGQTIQINDLAGIAEEIGLCFMSALTIDAAKIALAENSKHLEEWQQAGYAGDMSYMLRDKSLLCNLDWVQSSSLPNGAKSIITFAVPYYTKKDDTPLFKSGFGKVARYAWGLDYHLVLKQKIEDLVRLCLARGLISQIKYRVFSDSVPTLERTIAQTASLGFVGKSSMLIRPGVGTYFFLCELFSDLEISDEIELKKIKSKCGACTNCMDLCPTSAIIKEKTLDARRCISYLTIEKRDQLNKEEIGFLGDWVFGCDICQEVCPYNHNGLNLKICSEFDLTQGVGPYLNLEDILKISTEKEYKEKFKGTALLRCKREGLLRNALAVIANQKQFCLLDHVINLFKNDSSILLRNQSRVILEILQSEAEGLDLHRINNAFDF